MEKTSVVRGDAGWGDIVTCTAVPERDTDWPWDKGTGVPNSNPMESRFSFDVNYENGSEARLEGYGAYLVSGFGFMGPASFDEGGDNVRYGSRRLIACCVRCIDECRFFPFGSVSLPTKEESDALLEKFDVPKDIVPFDEASYYKVRGRWMKAMMADGRVICPTGGSVYTTWLYKEHVLRQTMLKAKGPLVELCNGVIKRADDLTGGEKMLIADPSESKINAQWLSIKEPSDS